MSFTVHPQKSFERRAVSAHLRVVPKTDLTPVFSLLIAGLLCCVTEARPAEDEPDKKSGLRKLQLVTDRSAISPGEPFTVALEIEPMPGYHTYWRGPGIVGVATNIEWSLPDGFSAGEIAWPPPQKVLMAGITAYGYRDRQLLLTEITPPQDLEGDTITLKARVAWMACSISCHPGFGDLTLTVPVNRTGEKGKGGTALSEAFDRVRRSIPPAAPASWKMELRSVAPDQIELDLIIPDSFPAPAQALSFFCYDMQVDSDEPQQVTVLADKGGTKWRLGLTRPDVAPRSPAVFAGVLCYPGGWPGLNSSFVEISIPWPPGTFSNE
jgi:DsbC/DsbD-like thiol-disulfide interchange protein